jgi:hypothetical protein
MPLVRVGMNDALPTVYPRSTSYYFGCDTERHTINESAQRPRRVLADREADEAGNQSPPAPTYASTSGPPDTPKQPGRHRPMARHTKRRDLSAAALTALPEIVACLCLQRASERGMAADATDYRPTAT